MATYSVNQVRHLYVANTVNDKVMATDTAGTIALMSEKNKSHLYFAYKGADNLMRSDLIDVEHILSAKATDASKMQRKLKTATVALDPEVNDGQPVAGQDYILRIAFRQYLGMSDEDQYFKFGMVHAYAGMTPSKFYTVLAMSLAKNFSREVYPLLKFKLVTSSGVVEKEVTPNSKIKPSSAAVGTFDFDPYSTEYTGVLLEEVEQDWRLGVVSQVPVYCFDNGSIQSSPIVFNGDERLWVTVTKGEGNTVHNGKEIADLEYFCMGERGDIYRQINWPHNIPTKYLVDPSKPYHVFDIHYAYVGEGEGVQKSEKTITIVCSDKTQLNKLITKFKTLTNIQVETLS